MSKHTPGPWTVEPPSDQTPHIWITAPTSSGVAKIETCDYNDGQGEKLTDEDFANAHLIAAAPDLHSAVADYLSAIDAEPEKDIWDTWDGKPADGAQKTSSDAAWADHGQRIEDSISKLRDALRKAGE